MKSPRAPRGPFRKRESVLCPDDLNSARAGLHGGSPESWLRVAAYLLCSAKAYRVDLTTALADRQSRGFVSNGNVDGHDKIKVEAGQGSDRTLPRISSGFRFDADY